MAQPGHRREKDGVGRGIDSEGGADAGLGDDQPGNRRPIKRAELNTIELIAKADGKAARSTKLEISAMREGCAKELVMPSSKVSANSHSIVIAPV
jgi:hypothetical protein